MKIILCLKQVPVSQDLVFDEKGNLKRENINSALNKRDDYAIDQALLIKEKIPNSEIIAITMGPESSKDILKYAISRGVDQALLLSDTLIKGSDTLITAKILSIFIREISNDFSIVLCGAKSSDGETSHVPSQLAYFLNLPFFSFVKNILNIENDHLILEREKNNYYEKVSIKYPCLLSIENNEKELKLISLKNKIKAKNYQVKTLTLKDLNINDISGDNSPTWVNNFEKEENNKNNNTAIITDENSLIVFLKKYVK